MRAIYIPQHRQARAYPSIFTPAGVSPSSTRGATGLPGRSGGVSGMSVRVRVHRAPEVARGERWAFAAL